MAIFISPGGGGGTPGGSDTQVQFNDGGAFGAASDLTYNKSTKVLTSKGDINLDDSGSFTTTLQCITATANRTLSLPDATGTVALVAGSSGQLLWNNSGANAGASTLTYDGSILTTSGRFINSYNAAASSPAKVWTGTWFTGGTATTTKPHVLIEPTGTTSTAWSTSGTGLGVNAPSGFAGNLLDLQVNGTSALAINSSGSFIKPAGSFVFNNGAAGTLTLAGQSSRFDIVGPAAGSLGLQTRSKTLFLDNTNTSGFLTIEPDRNIVGLRIWGGRPSSDVAVKALSILGPSALTSAATNISGGDLIIEGGAGASSSGGQANGGPVYLDGGQPFGTGTAGNIVIGATRGNLQITDARDIILGSTTGTKIGTATTQKLGFYNKTPVAQPTAVADLTTAATTGTLPTANGTVTIADAAAPTNAELLEYCVELEAKLEAALSRLRDLGLIAT